MTLRRNLIAGLASSIWSALIGLAVVPYYLKYLGVEAYGLIGFFVMTQALLQLLDMGMVPTINREVARCTASGDLKEAGKLLHTLAVVYWCIAVAIGLIVLGLAPWIVEYWLKSKQLSPQTVLHSVMLIGLVVACRWPIGLYQGALIGAQRLALSSTITMAMVTIGNLGAVVILAVYSPTIEAFFIWQACVGIAYALFMRFAAWQVIGNIKQKKFDFRKLKSVWHFTFGMSAIALMGAVFTQMDKVLLSNFLGLEEFAHYMLATLLVNGLYLLIMPIYNILYPRLSAIVASGNTVDLGAQYRMYTRVLTVVLFPPAIMLAVFSKELIELWTGNSNIAIAVAPIVTILTIGSTLNGVMTIPHALQLAFGMTRLPIIINGVLMVVMLPLIAYLSLRYEALGGAISWAILNLLYLLLGTRLTHVYLLVGLGMKWLVHDVLLPLGLVIAIGGLTKYACEYYEFSLYGRLATGAFVVLFMFAAALFMTPKLIFLLSREPRGGNV